MGQPDATTVRYALAGKQPSDTRPKTPYRVRKRQAFIGVFSTILAFCVIILGLSVFNVVLLNWSYNPPTADFDNPTRLNSYASVFFLFLTVPFVAMIWSSIELAFLTRQRFASKWHATSAAVFYVIWSIQLALACVYIWSNFSELWPVWAVPWCIIPLLVLYAAYFGMSLRAVVVDKRELKEQSRSISALTEDSLSLNTLCTSPAPTTLVTSTARTSTTDPRTSTTEHTRPPSYFSSSVRSYEQSDVKEVEPLNFT